MGMNVFKVARALTMKQNVRDLSNISTDVAVLGDDSIDVINERREV